MALFQVLHELYIEKAFAYIRTYGFSAFIRKVKKKMFNGEGIPTDTSVMREHPAVHFIRQKTAPLHLNLTQGEVERINLIISIIDFRYFFGGYIGVFNLAKKLYAEGLKVRLIVVDECKYEPEVWRREIKKYEGLEDFFDLIEVVYAFNRQHQIKVSRKDVFIATSWWTAHVANYARKYMNSKRFLYLIQEYEPVFYPMGTFAALALESYTFPHYAMFSTEILREYFRQNGLGVFREDWAAGDEASVAIENAILKFEVDKSRMAKKEKRKLLFYARPEEHAARNMFEIGIIALSNVIMGGHLDAGKWEFYGIGSVDWGNHKITLHNKTFLQLLPKMSLEEYKKLLPEFDIGLSLMLTPHPSLPPLEMAAAGMLVVTNTYANKTAECLREISTNIIPAEPTVEGLEGALITALRNVGDYDLRIKGSYVHWSQNWVDTFNDQVMGKIKGFIGKCVIFPSFLIASAREKKLAMAYIESCVKNLSTFVDAISPDDEMYVFTRNSTDQKEASSYLYFEAGKECFKSIENIILSSGRSLSEIGSYLDFACGYGRVTRFLVQELESSKVWVSDIYKDAVDFQKKYFGVNGFYSETEPSKVNFPMKYEVIYVGSLFSHLPESRFEEWLLTLYNTLEENGILIFSTHGNSLCPPAIKTDPSGFTFWHGSESRSLSTEEYGSTFVTRDWVERLAKKLGISNISFLEKGLAGYQDIYVAAKKVIPTLNNLVPANCPQGHIDSVQITEDGNVHVSGWAVDKELGAPVTEITIYAGDELLGKASLNMQRPDVASHFGRQNYLNSGWIYRGGKMILKHKVVSGNADSVLIKALIKNQKGEIACLVSLL